MADKTCDVLVVGAGIAGLAAAAAAAEEGRSVIVLEKGASYNFRGLHNAALNTSFHEDQHIRIDKHEVIHTILEFGAFRADYRLIKTWADNCDKVFAWLVSLSRNAGYDVVLDATQKEWHFKNFPVAHVFVDKNSGRQGQVILAKVLYDYCLQHEVKFLFRSRASSLVFDSRSKKILGVTVLDKKRELITIKAKRAVILATGDYGSNRRMVKKYSLPNVHLLPNMYPLATQVAYERVGIKLTRPLSLNTGDGHRMALSVGAAIDEPPHGVMLFDLTLWNAPNLFNLARQPWLWVNSTGERFTNEDLPWGYLCSQLMRQPKCMAWSIWDAKWEKEAPGFKSQCCKNMGPPTYLWRKELLEKAVAEGGVVVAWTLKELADAIGAPYENLEKTVSRYNYLARNGYDEDFGKHPTRLTTIEEPPYYACKVNAVLMVTLGGIHINTEMQVLDTGGNPIKGLYAAGNVTGGFFGLHYPTTIPGLSHSRAWTFGYLAGKGAALL